MSLYFKGIDWDRVDDKWTHIRTAEDNDWDDIAYIKWERGTNENEVVRTDGKIVIFEDTFHNSSYRETVKEFIFVGAENPSPLGDGMNATHRK